MEAITLTTSQISNLVLEGFSVKRLTEMQAPWQPYFAWIGKAYDAMRANDKDLAKQCLDKATSSYNALPDDATDDEDDYQFQRFHDKVQKFLDAA